MKTKHSPLPWAVGRSGVTITDGSPEQFLVANCHENTLDAVKANADFIVRACNNHDALVNALERLTEKVHRANDIRHSGGRIHAEDWSELYMLTNETRAVLANAKGE